MPLKLSIVCSARIAVVQAGQKLAPDGHNIIAVERLTAVRAVSISPIKMPSMA